MNIENHIAMQIYQLLLSIRDSAEYALLDKKHYPHIFYWRKSFMENALKEGAFVDMLKANKESGMKIYNNLYKLYRDLFADCTYLKVEDDSISRFDDDNNLELLEQLIGNYYVVKDILDYNVGIFQNVSEHIKNLMVSSHEDFVASVSYVLMVNLLQQKNLSLITKDEKKYISMVTLFYFFKDRAKPKDENIIKVLEDIEKVISFFSTDSQDKNLVDLVSSIYGALETIIPEKKLNWQKDYQASVEVIKQESNYDN